MFKPTRALPSLLLLVSLVFFGVGSAGAGDPANAGCLGCHEPTIAEPAFRAVEFVVPSVDYSSCSACHWIGMADLIDGEWAHQHLVDDPFTTCEECHLGQADYPDTCVVCVPRFDTAFGYFNSVDSLSTSADELHAIHANGSWPQETRFRPNYCASCHAPAACSACHVDAAEHGDHTGGPLAYPPETYLQSAGTPDSNPDVLATFTSPVTCTNDTCHSRASDEGPGFLPACLTCHAESAARHVSVHDVADEVTAGCRRCHGVALDDIHAKYDLGCDACHASADAVVSGAVASGSTACGECHGSVKHFGRR